MAIQKLKLTHFWDPGCEPHVDDNARFFALKRTLDNGLDSPEVWGEYLTLALKLGAHEQARIALQQLQHSGKGQQLIERMTAAGSLAPLTSNTKPEAGHPPRSSTGSPPGHSAAGGRSDSSSRRRSDPAGWRNPSNARQPSESQGPQRSRTRRSEPAADPQPPKVTESVREEALDALQFLLLESVPMKIVWFTVSFPAAIAVGQILLPSNSGFLAPLAVLPCLCVAAAVMHYARAIMLSSADGAEDPPAMSTNLVSGSLKAAGVSLLLFLACVGPALLGISLGKPPLYTIPLLAFGLLYLPMALLGVTVRQTLEAALPRYVFRGMAAYSTDYVKLWGVVLLASAIPAAVLALIGTAPLHMQIAVGGPLAVVPGLFLARLLGRYFYSRRFRLSQALGVRLRRSRKTRPARGPGGGRQCQARDDDPSNRRIEVNPPARLHRPTRNAAAQSSPKTVETPGQMGQHTHTPLRRKN